MPTTEPPLKYASGNMVSAAPIGNKRALIRPMTKAVRMIDSNIKYQQGQDSFILISSLSWQLNTLLPVKLCNPIT